MNRRYNLPSVNQFEKSKIKDLSNIFSEYLLMIFSDIDDTLLENYKDMEEYVISKVNNILSIIEEPLNVSYGIYILFDSLGNFFPEYKNWDKAMYKMNDVIEELKQNKIKRDTILNIIMTYLNKLLNRVGFIDIGPENNQYLKKENEKKNLLTKCTNLNNDDEYRSLMKFCGSEETTKPEFTLNEQSSLNGTSEKPMHASKRFMCKNCIIMEEICQQCSKKIKVEDIDKWKQLQESVGKKDLVLCNILLAINPKNMAYIKSVINELSIYVDNNSEKKKAGIANKIMVEKINEYKKKLSDKEMFYVYWKIIIIFDPIYNNDKIQICFNKIKRQLGIIHNDISDVEETRKTRMTIQLERATFYREKYLLQKVKSLKIHFMKLFCEIYKKEFKKPKIIRKKK